MAKKPKDSARVGVPKIILIGRCINDGIAALLDVEYPHRLYLFYFLLTQTSRLSGTNQGAPQPNLNTTIIKAIFVPLSPVVEQQRIVAEVERRLSVTDEAETTVEMNLKRAERLRQSILKRLFMENSYTIHEENMPCNLKLLNQQEKN